MAMLHPQEQLLRSNYEAFTNGDVSPILNSFADDIQWHVSGRSPVAGDYSGKAEVLDFFSRMMDLYGGTLRLEVIDGFANDEHGIVITRESAEFAGQPLEYSGIHHWTFDGPSCVRFQNYTDDAYDDFWAAV
jgi:uncharacterized protein